MKEDEHLFRPLGFQVIKETDAIVEAVACIFCEKTGLFRTKILTFRREFNEEDKADYKRKTSEQKE